MTHSEIIQMWPSRAAFSRETGVPYESARQYERENFIQAHWWTAIVDAAERRGFEGVSLEGLALHAAVQKNKNASHAGEPAPASADASSPNGRGL